MSVKQAPNRLRRKKKLPASKSKQKFRLLLVDDHPLVRTGVKELVEREPDMEVCGEAGSIPAALEAVERDQPDVVLVDITLGKENGFDLVRDIGFLHPHIATVVFTMHKEKSYVDKAMVAGAKALVLKQDAPAKLLEAIRSPRSPTKVKS